MPSLSLEAGAIIAGRYALERPLGQGGMGVVWEATHTVTRRSVAIKFLKDSWREQADLRRRFLREATAASALRHPNVVEILDVFDLEDSAPVQVMELLSGETLGEKIARDERLSLEETAALLLPVVSAVGTAHSLGIVHRDIKPENIFLAQAGDRTVVKVLDFGIAKLMTDQYNDRGSALHTSAGSMLGTPSYMAPEQATGDARVDHRVDIWSLGVLLYECLSGTRPIEGENLAQIVARLMSAGIIPLERLSPELPGEVAAHVMLMLSRDANRRPADLNELFGILSHYTRVTAPSFGPPISVERVSAAPPTPGQVRIVANPRVDPRGSTVLSAPPPPSSVTIDSLALKQQASAPPKRIQKLMLLGLALLTLAVVALRLGSRDAERASDVVAPSSSSAPSVTTAPGATNAPLPAASAAPSATSSAASAPRVPTRRLFAPPQHVAVPAAAARPVAPATPPKAPLSEDKLFGGRK